MTKAEIVEALRPFAAADRAIGNEPGPYRFETATGFRELHREDFARVRRVLDSIQSEAQEPSEQVAVLDLVRTAEAARSAGFAEAREMAAEIAHKLDYQREKIPDAIRAMKEPPR